MIILWQTNILVKLKLLRQVSKQAHWKEVKILPKILWKNIIFQQQDTKLLLQKTFI